MPGATYSPTSGGSDAMASHRPGTGSLPSGWRPRTRRTRGYQDRLASAYNHIAIARIKAGRVAQASRHSSESERSGSAWPPLIRRSSEYQKNLAVIQEHQQVEVRDESPDRGPGRHRARRGQIRARLVAENPTVSQLQYELAKTLLAMGRHHRAIRAAGRGLGPYTEAGAILTRLVAANPSVTDFQERLWRSGTIRPTSTPFRADTTEALADYERARAIQARMVADHPELPELRHTLGILDTDIGAATFSSPADSMPPWSRPSGGGTCWRPSRPRTPRYPNTGGIWPTATTPSASCTSRPAGWTGSRGIRAGASDPRPARDRSSGHPPVPARPRREPLRHRLAPRPSPTPA